MVREGKNIAQERTKSGGGVKRRVGQREQRRESEKKWEGKKGGREGGGKEKL